VKHLDATQVTTLERGLQHTQRATQLGSAVVEVGAGVEDGCQGFALATGDGPDSHEQALCCQVMPGHARSYQAQPDPVPSSKPSHPSATLSNPTPAISDRGADRRRREPRARAGSSVSKSSCRRQRAKRPRCLRVAGPANASARMARAPGRSPGRQTTPCEWHTAGKWVLPTAPIRATAHTAVPQGAVMCTTCQKLLARLAGQAAVVAA